MLVLGHCRRRKIRCIPAYEDTTGTCQNCIRLKKDCHFFPVDQQIPFPGRRIRTGSKSESQREGETSGGSSSPGVLVSSSVEQIKNVNGQMSTPPLSQNGSHPRFGALGGELRQNGTFELVNCLWYTLTGQDLHIQPTTATLRVMSTANERCLTLALRHTDPMMQPHLRAARTHTTNLQPTSLCRVPIKTHPILLTLHP